MRCWRSRERPDALDRLLNLLRSRFTQVHTIHRVVQVDRRQIARTTLLLGLVFAALLAIPFVFYQRAESRNNLQLLQAEQERVVKLAAATIHGEIDTVLSDLRYLAQHRELRAYLADPTGSSRLELADEYLGMVREKGIYDRIRFIDPAGREAVGVAFNAGRPAIVPDQGLQDRHADRCVQRALHVASGRIAVSALEPDAADDGQSVLRFAVPVTDATGQRRGLVALSYLAERLRDKLNALEGKRNKLWLLDPDGAWLLATASPQSAGGAAAQPQPRIGTLFPRLWRQMQAEGSGVYRSPDSLVLFERVYPLRGEAGPAGGAAFARPVAADHYYWTIAAEIPQSALDEVNRPVWETLWSIYAALVVFAFLIASALALVSHRNKALATAVEKVVDGLPILLAYVDTEQRYRFNNMAYEHFFGLKPKEIYGRTMRELLGETVYLQVEAHVARALGGETVSFERQLRNQSGVMQDVAVSYLPDLAPQGQVRGFYVTVSDISLLKESERRERQRMLEIAHVSRLASMGEMATEIAHEINQPLAAIAMYSAAGQRLLQGGQAGGQLKAWLEAINVQAKRASEIVRRVRQFVRKEAHQSGPVDLNPVAREVAALLDHEARSHGVDVALDLAEALPAVAGDRVLLEQALFNLARHALDATLTVEGERRVTLRTFFDAELVYVEVSDTGTVVDPVLREHLFDAVVSGGRGKSGMELGIGRSIIEAHGGTLRYVARPEGGNVFMFNLARDST